MHESVQPASLPTGWRHGTGGWGSGISTPPNTTKLSDTPLRVPAKLLECCAARASAPAVWHSLPVLTASGERSGAQVLAPAQVVPW